MMPQDDYSQQPIEPGSLPANTYSHGISYPVSESMSADSIPADGLGDDNLSSDTPSLSITLSGIDDFSSFESHSQSVVAKFIENTYAGGGAQTPVGFMGAVGAIANSSIVDVTINQMQIPGGILPAVSITDFYVLVNGVLRGVKSAVRRGASAYYDLRTVRLTLASPVRHGDIVEVTYINTSSAGSVIDTDSPSCASLPTTISSPSHIAKTDGVNLSPSALGMISIEPSSRRHAATLFVVPRSIPRALIFLLITNLYW